MIRIVTKSRLDKLERAYDLRESYEREIIRIGQERKPVVRFESHPSLYELAQAQATIKFLEARLATYQKLAGIKLSAKTILEQVEKEES